ncbi:UGSC family (seleno)protein [Actinomadura sp. 1N219]|uniref:UGSC family (seleno)protein n=1 Tax=Actinomadura sp. 1N219 TaxID=3375152 RepID=UPI0037B00256
MASTSRLAGVPTLRHAFVPSPVPGRTAGELRGYVEGDNPVSGNPFARDLLDGLTRPLDEADMAGATFEQARSRLLEPATEDDLHALFLENGWTDKLPIVLPTEERVAAMLAGTGHAPSEVVGRLRAASTRDYWEFTVEQAAVNAVMAGAAPEYFPVILALLGSGYSARHSSISSMSEAVVVNGPIRDEIGMNSGIGALGPYSRANATIGRAYGIGSQNLQGGSSPGISYMGSIGNPFSFTNLTFAENEEHSPWEAYHVQHGFAPGDSTATVFRGVRTMITAPSGIRDDWRDHARTIFNATRASGGAVLLLDPLAAQNLVEHQGFARKEDLIEWISGAGRLPARRWWAQGLQELFFGYRAEAGEEPWATYRAAAPDEEVRINVPEDVHVIVVGGRSAATWSVLEGMANGTKLDRSLSGRTVSVDEWR